MQKRISTYNFIVEVVDAIPVAGIKQAPTVIRRVSHNLQDRGMTKLYLNVRFSPFFSGIVLVMREKKTTFVHEESVLLISAE